MLGINNTMRILLIAVLTVFLTGSSYIWTPVEVVTLELKLPRLEETTIYRQWNISYPVSAEELGCLALNIYFEARNQDPEGQFAVADVVMHRVNHYEYPNTVCGVVKKGIYVPWMPTMPLKWKCHFTWFCDRKTDVPVDLEAFKEAMIVANTVLNDPYYLPVVQYALYYHADYVEPWWAEERTRVAYIGNHLFY